MQNLEKNLSMYNLIFVIKLVFLMTLEEFVIMLEFVSSFNNRDSKFFSVDISLNFDSILGVTDFLEE